MRILIIGLVVVFYLFCNSLTTLRMSMKDKYAAENTDETDDIIRRLRDAWKIASSNSDVIIRDDISTLNVSDSQTVGRRKVKRSTYHYKRDRIRYRSGKCQRSDYLVNFVELGWDKWVLYPTQFNAYICNGSCELPIRAMSRSLLQRDRSSGIKGGGIQVTNHAQIMSILEYRNPGSREMSKCVSTKLRPLTVIFLDEYGRMKIKDYQDMIVEECGCR